MRHSADGTAIARSQRDPEAFAAIFDRHFVAVHRYLARRVGSHRADDIAAQTFTLAFAHRGRYRDDLGTARPWLLGIATNLLRADYRAEQRRLAAVSRLGGEPVSDTDGDGGLDPEIASALSRLDRPQRDALLLHVWGELSYPEIAAALEIPVGTVRSRISRACAALRTTFTERNAHA